MKHSIIKWIHKPSHCTYAGVMGCDATEATGLDFVCFVVISPRVLSAKGVDLGFFCFINFPFHPPPPRILPVTKLLLEFMSALEPLYSRDQYNKWLRNWQRWGKILFLQLFHYFLTIVLLLFFLLLLFFFWEVGFILHASTGTSCPFSH